MTLGEDARPDDGAPEEEILQRVLTGELAAESAELRELWARRPGLRRDLEQCLALQRRLDLAALVEREELAAALAAVTPADRASLERVAGAAARTAGPRWPRTAWLAAAALALLASGAVWIATRGAGPNPAPRSEPTFLGPERPSPLGSARRTGHRLEWSEAPGATHYQVRAFAREGDSTSTDAALSRTVRSQAWLTLSDDEWERAPSGAVLWKVDAWRGLEWLGAAELAETEGWRTRSSAR